MMKIENDEHAISLIGTQVYVFTDNELMPMSVNKVVINKTISGVNGIETIGSITTAIGTFDSEEVYESKEAIMEYIDSVITG